MCQAILDLKSACGCGGYKHAKPVVLLPGCNSEAIYFVSDYNGNQVRAFDAQSGAYCPAPFAVGHAGL